jgi:hypothetical protein
MRCDESFLSQIRDGVNESHDKLSKLRHFPPYGEREEEMTRKREEAHKTSMSAVYSVTNGP